MKTRELFISVLFVIAAAGAAVFYPGEAHAAKKKIYRVEVRTTTFGGSGYILGFGATDILNKKSEWVRGSVLESSGTPENIKTVGRDPKKRKRTFFTTSYEMFEMAKKGEGLFKEKAHLYQDLKALINEQKLIAYIITLDPNIRTLDQLRGKRVATWPKGTTKYQMTYNLIAGAGKDVADSIEWQFTGYTGYSDMLVGKVDAAISFSPERGRGVFTTIPKMKELMTKRRLYFVSATPEQRKKSAELFGDAYGATMVLPKNTFGDGIPRQDITGFAIIIAWGAYPELPDEVAYEIVQTLHENYGMMKDYHSAGKAWFPENFGTYPAKKDDFHAGARKYYDAHGIQYGRDYFLEVYSKM
jgi:TRAP transporter TAXI family solute receptor